MSDVKNIAILNALKDVDAPKVLRITEGSLNIPKWRTFKQGECVVVFSCGEHVIVMNTKKKESNYLFQDCLGFIPLKTKEHFFDVHCVGKTYESVDKLIEDFPRLIVPNHDFFALCDKNGECENIKIEKKCLLELEEIRDYKTQTKEGTYTNAFALQGEMLCCSVLDGKHKGSNVILSKALKLSAEISSDEEKYTMSEIVERFPLPRKLKFASQSINEYLEELPHSENEILASSVSNPMIFIGDIGRANLTCIDDHVQECENIVRVLLEDLDLSGVKVEVVEDSIEDFRTFVPIYATQQLSSFGDAQTYQFVGLERDSQEQTIREDLPKVENNGQKDIQTELKKEPEYGGEYVAIWTPNESDSNKAGTTHEVPPRDETEKNTNIVVEVSLPPRIKDKPLDPRKNQSCEKHLVKPIQIFSEPNPPMSREDIPISEPIPPRVKSRSLPKSFPVQPTAEVEKDITSAKRTDVVEKDIVSAKRTDEVEKDVALAKRTDEVEKDISSAKSTDEVEKDMPVGKMTAEVEKDVPLAEMTVKQLYNFLRNYNLGKLANVCVTENIDGEFIAELTDTEFKEEPFFLKDFQIKKLNKLKSGWRAT